MTYSRTTVYNINDHIVWSVKYGQKVITLEVKSHMHEVLHWIADTKGFKIDEFESEYMDHVHLFVTAPPKLSGRKLLEKFPELRQKLWNGELCNHSTYIETIGDVSSETIRKYIEHQSKQY